MQSLYNKNHKIKKMNNHPGKNPRQYKNEKTIPYDIHFFLALKYFSFHYFPQTLSFTTQMTASKGQKQVTWSRFSDLAFPFTSCRSRAQCITMSFSLKSIFSIKKCDCKSAGFEFSQFFSRKCLYFTLRIIFAAYRILHSHFSFWFLCVFINISHCFSLLCFC